MSFCSKHVVQAANQFVQSISGRLKSTPVVSKSQEDGWVQITHYVSSFMYQPLVNELLQNLGKGNTSVLTQTNEEAVTIVALLRKHGIKAKLIQSMEGFRFWNMAEMRFFLKQIDKGTNNSVVISDDLWQQAKESTNKTYAQSNSLPYVQRCVKLFEETNKTKYVTDFKEFVFESSIENFCDLTNADVVVSTIHRAKGKEFDDVYMMLNDAYSKDANLLRRYYVGMTRAKKRLFIHTNSQLFNRIQVDKHIADQQQYSLPDEVVLQLSHKDVYLGFFKNKKRDVLSLRSGAPLEYRDFMLYSTDTKAAVAKLSVRMQENLTAWKERGYSVTSASVRFIVAWKPQDSSKEEAETAVLLPDLVLQRHNNLSGT